MIRYNLNENTGKLYECRSGKYIEHDDHVLLMSEHKPGYYASIIASKFADLEKRIDKLKCNQEECDCTQK